MSAGNNVLATMATTAMITTRQVEHEYTECVKKVLATLGNKIIESSIKFEGNEDGKFKELFVKSFKNLLRLEFNYSYLTQKYSEPLRQLVQFLLGVEISASEAHYSLAQVGGNTRTAPSTASTRTTTAQTTTTRTMQTIDSRSTNRDSGFTLNQPSSSMKKSKILSSNKVVKGQMIKGSILEKEKENAGDEQLNTEPFEWQSKCCTPSPKRGKSCSQYKQLKSTHSGVCVVSGGNRSLNQSRTPSSAFQIQETPPAARLNILNNKSLQNSQLHQQQVIPLSAFKGNQNQGQSSPITLPNLNQSRCNFDKESNKQNIEMFGNQQDSLKQAKGNTISPFLESSQNQNQISGLGQRKLNGSESSPTKKNIALTSTQSTDSKYEFSDTKLKVQGEEFLNQWNNLCSNVYSYQQSKSPTKSKGQGNEEQIDDECEQSNPLFESTAQFAVSQVEIQIDQKRNQQRINNGGNSSAIYSQTSHQGRSPNRNECIMTGARFTAAAQVLQNDNQNAVLFQSGKMNTLSMINATPQKKIRMQPIVVASYEKQGESNSNNGMMMMSSGNNPRKLSISQHNSKRDQYQNNDGEFKYLLPEKDVSGVISVGSGIGSGGIAFKQLQYFQQQSLISKQQLMNEPTKPSIGAAVDVSGVVSSLRQSVVVLPEQKSNNNRLKEGKAQAAAIDTEGSVVRNRRAHSSVGNVADSLYGNQKSKMGIMRTMESSNESGKHRQRQKNFEDVVTVNATKASESSAFQEGFTFSAKKQQINNNNKGMNNSFVVSDKKRHGDSNMMPDVSLDFKRASRSNTDFFA